jgi:hypothetical protein
MTKRDGFPLGACGDDVPNLHLVVGDDDAIDQQFHQLSALGKRELVQGRLHLPAKRVESLGQGSDIHLLLRLRLQLAQLLRQALLGLGHLLSFAFELVAPDDLGQIDLQQAGLLPFELCEGFTEGLPPGLERLGQPFATVGPREFMGKERWLSQDSTEILPDQLIQDPGRGKARRAAFALRRPQRIGPTAAEIVVVPRGKGTSHTRQLTLATADQATEQVLMGGVVPTSHLGIACQPGLGRRKGLLTNDGRHRDGNPFVGRGRPMTVPRAHGAQGGLTDARGHWTGALAIGRAGVDRRAKDTTHGGHIPAWPPAWSRELVVGQTLGQAIEGGRRLGIGIPRKDLGDHRGFDRVDPEALRIAGPLGIHHIAIRWHAPRQHLAAAQLGLAAASHPVRDKAALILGHGTPDLEEELIVRILTHRSLQKLHLASPLRQFVDQEHLVDIVAGQPVWSGDQDPLKAGHGRAVSQAIQAGPIELGSAIALIAVDMLLREMPVRVSREVLAQASHLLLNRLGVLLTGGRNTDIQGHFHGIPPAGVMAQAKYLCRGPSPIAEGTGRLRPTVVHRRSVRSPCGVSARVFSWVPPACRTYATQEDTLMSGLAPQPLRPTPPGELEYCPPSAAEFVI